MIFNKCPECGEEVSKSAKACGHPVSSRNCNCVKISIEQHPDVDGFPVSIRDMYGNLLVDARAGSVAELRTEKPMDIQFCGTYGGDLYTTTVYPGKRYLATWGLGFLSPKITSCREADT